MTAHFSHTKTGASFNITSSTEKVALDRIESKRAIDLIELRDKYKIIVESIDESLKELQQNEKEFIKLRYFNEKSWTDIQKELNYSERQLFYIRKKSLDKLLISLKNLFTL